VEDIYLSLYYPVFTYNFYAIPEIYFIGLTGKKRLAIDKPTFLKIIEKFV
jgi:hypothetical protein